LSLKVYETSPLKGNQFQEDGRESFPEENNDNNKHKNNNSNNNNNNNKKNNKKKNTMISALPFLPAQVKNGSVATLSNTGQILLPGHCFTISQGLVFQKPFIYLCYMLYAD